jgi:hypothetical protein
VQLLPIRLKPDPTYVDGTTYWWLGMVTTTDDVMVIRRVFEDY